MQVAIGRGRAWGHDRSPSRHDASRNRNSGQPLQGRPSQRAADSVDDDVLKDQTGDAKPKSLISGQNSGPFADSAVGLAELGFRVLPVRPGAKVPATRGWPTTATSDRAVVAEWLDQHGAGNLGIATGEGIVVIDTDIRPNRNGEESLAAIQLRRGDLPQTVTSQTPSGGRHRYFRLPVGVKLASRNGVAAGIDIKGCGGFVVAPPSTIAGAQCDYKWQLGCSPFDVELKTLPDNWVKWLTGSARDGPAPVRSAVTRRATVTSAYGRAALECEVAKLAGTLEGDRNNSAFKAALKIGSLISGGEVAPQDAEPALALAAVAAGLDTREATRTIRSGIAAGMQSPRSSSGDQAATHVALPRTVYAALLRACGPGVGIVSRRDGWLVVDGKCAEIATFQPKAGSKTTGAELLAQVARGVALLRTLIGFRVVQHLVVTAHQQHVAGLATPHRITTVGGWSALAAKGAGKSRKVACAVRDIIVALAHLSFPWPNGNRSCLLDRVDWSPSRPNRQAEVVVEVNAPLLPGFCKQIPKGEGRQLVPILSTLPKLHALPAQRLYPAGLRLHQLFLVELTGRALELEVKGGIALAEAAWERLANAAGLANAHMVSLRKSWQETTDAGEALVREVRPGIWTLAGAHYAAVAFITARTVMHLRHKGLRPRGSARCD